MEKSLGIHEATFHDNSMGSQEHESLSPTRKVFDYKQYTNYKVLDMQFFAANS